MYKGNSRYEVEGSVHAGSGKNSRLIPGSYQDHHDQTETQELVHDTEPGDGTLYYFCGFVYVTRNSFNGNPPHLTLNHGFPVAFTVSQISLAL